jgi:hypothetical protein
MAKEQIPGQGATYGKARKLGQAVSREISVVSKFPLTYRNREDITNLPQGVLVVGSQNILSNVSERLEVRKGYKMDGAKSTINAPILSSFDWFSKSNSEIHMRAGFLTTALNDGKLQFRYLNSSSEATWQTLLSSLTTVSYNFTSFWDTTELIRKCLFVNGTSNIYEWSGAYDLVTSITTNTIVLNHNASTTGFYASSNKVVTINNIDYTYTGITTTTLTGVTPDPTGNVSANDICYQKVVTTALSSMSGISSTYTPGLISTRNNQIYLGSLTSSTFYVSKVNNYSDYSYSTGRLPGEGMTGTLDDNMVALIPQEENMYFSCGKDFWYQTKLTQSTGTVWNGSAQVAVTYETFEVLPLKNNPGQAAQSQGLTGKMKNNVLIISHEPTLDSLGRVDQILGTPQTTNISDSIKLDFDSYDFTNGHVFYWKWWILVSVPLSGIIRIYSLATKSWEAPQTIPVSRFYTIDGELYGHSYNTSESYKLFTGYSDRAVGNTSGSPYNSIANFSYQNFGTRTHQKNANEFYIEGYITPNTSLNCLINYEQDGNLTTQTFTVLGDDTALVGSSDSNNSLGAYPLGSQPGGSTIPSSLTGLPPKFRVIKTFPRFDFYECQFSFTISGIDQNFQLLAFGLNAGASDTTNSYITE